MHGDYTQEFVNVLALAAGSLQGVPEAVPYAADPSTRESMAAWEPLRRLANTNAQRLQNIINGVHRAGGGTVYFPPGRYFIGRNAGAYGSLIGAINGMSLDTNAAIDWSKTTDLPDVLVYADVTLRLAPGAVLVPMNFQHAGVDHWRAMEGCSAEDPLVRIEIQGDLIADLREIFATNLYPRVDEGKGEHFLRAGKILFTGNRVRAVYPEWWGVESTLDQRWPLRHQRAFQAAIDAAHTDRHRPRRSPDGNLVFDAEGFVRWEPRTTIPLVALYQYGLAGGLQVGETDAVRAMDDPRLRLPNPSPFVFRGHRETGQSAFHTLYAAEVFDEPMLDLRRTPFVIDKVCFDGNRLSRTFVRVEPGADGLCAFEGCTFHKLRLAEDAALVRLEGGRSFAALSVTPAEEATPRAVTVAFTRCRFEGVALGVLPSGQERTPPGLRRYPRRMSALTIDVDDRVGVELRNCFLIGIADPLIRAWRGHFALNEVTFHALRSVHPPLPDVGDPASVRRFLNTADGTDVFIEAPRRYIHGNEAPASFTARESETQSFQFLATYSPADGEHAPGLAQTSPSTGSRSACVLLNVRHTAVVGDGSLPPNGRQGNGGVDAAPFDARYYRPSIYWEGPAERGAELVAIGCKLRWDYWDPSVPDRDRPAWVRATGGTMGAIQVSASANAPVYHLGNMIHASFDSHRVASVAALLPSRIVASVGPSLQVRALPIGILNRSET